jgi:copper chaperone CopZ
MKRSFMKPLMFISVAALAAIAFFANSALSTSPTDGNPVFSDNHKAVLSVEGMTCSGCIYTIKNSLAGLEGIDDVQVDVTAGTAVIVYDRAQQPEADKMAAAITASGYPAKVQRILSPEQIQQQALKNQAKSGSAIAAVGSAEIPRTNFEAEMAHAKSRYLMAYGAGAFENTQGQQLLDNLKSQIAQRLIDETIQLQEVRRAGFTVAPSIVAQQYKAFWQERGFTDSTAFERALEKNGYSSAYFRKRFENRVLINTYIDNTVMTTHLNEIEKKQRYADWFANARLLAEVTYYDKDLERLVQQKSSGGGCGNSCSAGQ